MDGQWMAGSLQKPGEAGRRPTGVSGEPGPSLWPPGSQDVQGSAGPGCPADFSLLRMVFGLLPICWLFGLVSLGGWEGYIHLLFAGACGGLTCCAVRRLPEGISAPAASPAVQFP